MIGVILLTLRELIAKKIILALLIVSTLFWILLSFALNLEVVDGTLAGLRIFGGDLGIEASTSGEGAAPEINLLENIVFGFQTVVAGFTYWVGILLGLFATAPSINNLLEKGRVDLLLSKPIGRLMLLGSHLLGVVLVIFVLALYMMGSLWLVMSIKSGIWNFQFLTSIGMAVLMFTIMYSVIMFIGVSTKSTALSLIATLGLIICSLVFLGNEGIVKTLNIPWRQIYQAFYLVLPNFAEVTQPVTQLAAGETVETWYPLILSVIFGIVMYILAALRFSYRDF